MPSFGFFVRLSTVIVVIVIVVVVVDVIVDVCTTRSFSILFQVKKSK